jgi:hypothetical protein
MAPILGIYASQISGHLFAPSGAYDSIATTTVGSGGSASVTFSSIPATYTHLQVRAIGIGSTNGVTFRIRMNSDTGSNYATHYLLGDGATASAGAITSTTSLIWGTTPESTTYPGAAVCDILDYANANKYKTTRSLAGGDMNGSGGYAALYSGLWMNTAAVTSLTLFPGAGNFAQYSSFALYGIRGN